MTMLVTLDQAKAHLHLDHDLDDEDLELKIEAASAAILGHIGDAQYLFLDSSGDAIELEDTSTDQAAHRALHISRQATLMMVAEFYRNREPTATDLVPSQYGYGYLPRAVVALLTKLRTPTVA